MNKNLNSKSELTKAHYELLIVKEQYNALIRPWYKKNKIWSFIITSVLTFISLIILFNNGLFDFKTKELELKRENLKFDINKFTSERDSLISNRFKLESDNKQLLIQKNQLELATKVVMQSINSRDTIFARIIARNIMLENRNQYLEEENKSLNIKVNNSTLLLSPTLGYSQIGSSLLSSNSNALGGYNSGSSNFTNTITLPLSTISSLGLSNYNYQGSVTPNIFTVSPTLSNYILDSKKDNSISYPFSILSQTQNFPWYLNGIDTSRILILPKKN